MPDLSEVLAQLSEDDLRLDNAGRVVIANPAVLQQIKDVAGPLRRGGISPVGFLDNKCGTNQKCGAVDELRALGLPG